MKRFLKRVLSMVLVAAMVITLSAAVFAVDVGEQDEEEQKQAYIAALQMIAGGSLDNLNLVQLAGTVTSMIGPMYSAIASGDMYLPTYIVMQLNGTPDPGSLKVMMGLKTLSKATVAGYPNGYALNGNQLTIYRYSKEASLVTVTYQDKKTGESRVQIGYAKATELSLETVAALATSTSYGRQPIAVDVTYEQVAQGAATGTALVAGAVELLMAQKSSSSFLGILSKYGGSSDWASVIQAVGPAFETVIQ